MGSCPACGTEVPADRSECPSCHLARGLFDAVREAAGASADTDPAYVRTVAELLQSVELSSPAVAEPTPAPLWRPSAGSREPGSLELPRSEPSLRPAPVHPLEGIPPPPPAVHGELLRRRAEEYAQLARRLGIDLTALVLRLRSAETAGDEGQIDAVMREIFVHVVSALTVAYDAELARRNEIAQFVPTPSADVELEAIRGAMAAGDLGGALRRLAHARDTIGRLEELWATGRILIASCDLLAETIRELGGDPAPALGPYEEGRRQLADGRRELGERLLARGAYALWAVLEPRFFDELKRLRDRLLELRTSGAELGSALADLRAVATELKRRNFVGTVVSYRALRAFVGPAEGPEATPAAVAAPEAGPERPAPSG